MGVFNISIVSSAPTHIVSNLYITITLWQLSTHFSRDNRHNMRYYFFPNISYFLSHYTPYGVVAAALKADHFYFTGSTPPFTSGSPYFTSSSPCFISSSPRMTTEIKHLKDLFLIKLTSA